MSNEHLKQSLRILVVLAIVILAAFGFIRLGSLLFDLPEANDNSIRCWEAGGIPQFDTKGSQQDFTGCKK